MLESGQKNNDFQLNNTRHYKIFTVDSRLRYFKPHASEVARTFADEICSGLDRESKYINPKFFYDKVGSDLFEKICVIPEYYLTRTELGVLESVGRDLDSVLAGKLADAVGSGRTMVADRDLCGGGDDDDAKNGDGDDVENYDCGDVTTSGDGDAKSGAVTYGVYTNDDEIDGGGDGAAFKGAVPTTDRRSKDTVIRLVELGSGSSLKTRLLLEPLFEMQDRTEYFPIDISDILAESSERLLADYDNLEITGIIDTYEGGLEFLRTYDDKRNLIAFLGSSYGNLSPKDGARFLRDIQSAMKPGDLFLIGLDMVKDVSVLKSAYDDPGGVTAAFNLNVLSRINAELDADFDLANFAHRADYNADAQRVEMHLESLCDQSVVISKAGLELHLRSGELIHTENSYKYRPDQVCSMLDSAGFELLHMWMDSLQYVTLTLAAAP